MLCTFKVKSTSELLAGTCVSLQSPSVLIGDIQRPRESDHTWQRSHRALQKPEQLSLTYDYCADALTPGLSSREGHKMKQFVALCFIVTEPGLSVLRMIGDFVFDCRFLQSTAQVWGEHQVSYDELCRLVLGADSFSLTEVIAVCRFPYVCPSSPFSCTFVLAG